MSIAGRRYCVAEQGELFRARAPVEAKPAGIRRGTQMPNHKLNDYEVRTIRGLWPSHSFRVLARMYGLSPAQVHRIVRGRKWRHV